MNPSLRDRGSTGDASFDGRFHGRSPGPNHALLAALSSRLRQQLSFAHGRSFESLTADREAVTFRFLRSPCKVADLAQVEDTIHRCIAPAQTLLYDRAPLADELLHNALHDPQEGVRLNNARALVYAMPKSTQASEACDRLARSGDPVDATLAPKMNGAIGALIAAFSSLCGRMSGDDDRITYVVDHIVEAPPAHPSAPPWAYAAALCSQELPVPVTAVFQAVLWAEVPWALRWFRSLEAPGQLAPVLPELLELEARGLEDLLIYLLEDGGLSSRHVVAIIGELARVGTVGSIPQLRTHCDEFWDPPGPRDAARDAIDAIRARVPGAEVGQLAVVGEDPKQGGLSETPE